MDHLISFSELDRELQCAFVSCFIHAFVILSFVRHENNDFSPLFGLFWILFAKTDSLIIPHLEIKYHEITRSSQTQPTKQTLREAISPALSPPCTNDLTLEVHVGPATLTSIERSAETKNLRRRSEIEKACRSWGCPLGCKKDHLLKGKRKALVIGFGRVEKWISSLSY